MNIAELRAAVLRYQATSSLEHTMAEHQLRNLAAVALPALLAVAEAVIGEHGIAERLILIEKAIAYREARLVWEDDATRRASLKAQNADAKNLAAALRNLDEKGKADDSH